MTETVRILLIDDDQVDRAAVRRALGKAGLAFDLVEARSGSEGLARAGERAFDCVLLDYRLPDIDAVQLLGDLLRTGPRGNAVIVLTGESNPDIPDQMMRAGAVDFLSKAEVTPSSLARSIRYARARGGFLAELDSARTIAEEKTRELQVLNDQKDLLFSIIAHDLRNPFQALLGLSELQRRAAERSDLAGMVRYASSLNLAANQASALMEGLFAWASLQLTSTDVVRSEVDIQAVADETLASVSEAVARKQLTVRCNCAGAIAAGDPGMVTTILRNLVNNAIKFTTPGGTVTVAANLVDGEVQVDVSDTGVGIPPETARNLFRLDRRATRPGTAGEPGSGLGLMICETLVTRLGGVLTLASTSDVGSSFRFTLPRGAAAPSVVHPDPGLPAAPETPDSQ